MVLKSEKAKNKKKVLSSFSNFTSYHFQYSFFSIFHPFPFFPCLFFPGRSAEISQSEVSGGHCPPTCYATARLPARRSQSRTMQNKLRITQGSLPRRSCTNYRIMQAHHAHIMLAVCSICKTEYLSNYKIPEKVEKMIFDSDVFLVMISLGYRTIFQKVSLFS